MADKNVAASRDEYLIAVGKVTQNAAVGDAIMATALRYLIPCPMKTANAIFFTVDSLANKKALLNRVVAVTGDTTDQQLIQAMIKAAEKMNNQRREVAHAFMLTKNPDGSGPFAVQRPKSGNKVFVSKGWLKHLVNQSAQASRDCLDAFRKLAQKHNRPPTPGS
jgi:hypothetical protein